MRPSVGFRRGHRPTPNKQGNPVAIDVFTVLNDPNSGQHFVVVTGISSDPNNGNVLMVTYIDPFTGAEETATWDQLWTAWSTNNDANGTGNGWWLTFNQP